MSSASPSQPPARRQGSFHPQALLEPLDVPGESNSAPVEPRFTLPAVPSCVPQVRAMLIVAASTLLIAAPIVLMFMPAADPGSADVHAVAAAVPAAISLVTSLAVSSSWLLFPGVRNAHFGQAVCLLLACVWYSATWLVALYGPDQSSRRVAFKLNLVAFIATFLWSWPIGIDWLLLMTGERRGSGAARRFLAIACHCTWLVAAGLGLPIVRSDAAYYNISSSADSPLTNAATHLPTLIFTSITPSWWPSLLVALWLATTVFNLLVFVLGWSCSSSASTVPKVVAARHKQRALCTAVAFFALQPPTALMGYYALHSAPDTPAPSLLLLWSAMLGVPWMGCIHSVLCIMHEPNLRSALRGWWACCCGSNNGPVELTHADSRFVHFERPAGLTAEAEEAEADLLVRRVLNAEGEPTFRMALILLPAGLVAGGLAVVLILKL